MEQLSRKWWVYFLLSLILFIPPLTPTGFVKFSELVKIVKYNAEFIIAKKEILIPYMPIFHIFIILVFFFLVIHKNKFGKAFSIITGLHFILLGYQQGFAITEKYGIILYPNVILLVLIIAFNWFWEAKIRKVDFSLIQLQPKNLWLILVAIFSFWNPDKFGNYSLLLFLTSTSPVAFCMMYSIYLVTLVVLFPRINIPMFRIISFLGILNGIVAIGMGFFFDDRNEGIYWSLLHTPLIIVSIYSLILGFKQYKNIPKKDNICL